MNVLVDFVNTHVTGVWAMVIVALLGCVEVSKIKISPISFFLAFIGRKCNKDLYERMETFEQKQEEITRGFETVNGIMQQRFELIDDIMDKKFDELDSKQDTREAKRLRATLISFADSCRLGVKHTKVQFENVFRDYDDYLFICEKRHIKNNYIEEEMEFVRGIYQECLKNNSFL